MKHDYLIKLLEEYTDPSNKMDEQPYVKIIRSTNRDAQAREMLHELKCGNIPDKTKDLLEVAVAMRTYIDAIPDDLASQFPAMPGFDRDWADSIIEGASHD